jgi:hypothetical protein
LLGGVSNSPGSRKFLVSVPDDFFKIKVLAHKADVMRAMLLAGYGGMWLSLDAIVLRGIGNLFDLLEDYGFNRFKGSHCAYG